MPEQEVEDGPYGRWLHDVRNAVGEETFWTIGRLEVSHADALLRSLGVVMWKDSEHYQEYLRLVADGRIGVRVRTVEMRFNEAEGRSGGSVEPPRIRRSPFGREFERG